MAPNNAPWDIHVHVFDPAAYPYSSNRTYTPPAALPQQLFAASPGTNFLLVQATIEDGPDGLLHQLTTLTKSEPARIFRGAIMIDSDQLDSATATLSSKADEWHKMGVRCLRVHGQFNSSSPGLVDRMSTVLQGSITETARQHGWSISMRLPINVWAAMEATLESHCSDLTIIAEHDGAFNWPLLDNEASAFETFLNMLRKELIYVKLGALHRRVAAGCAISELQPALRSIAEAGPRQLLWGSDWPHVDTDAKGMVEAPFIHVDEQAELEVIRRCMDENCFDAMLQQTPEKLFR